MPPYSPGGYDVTSSFSFGTFQTDAFCSLIQGYLYASVKQLCYDQQVFFMMTTALALFSSLNTSTTIAVPAYKNHRDKKKDKKAKSEKGDKLVNPSTVSEPTDTDNTDTAGVAPVKQ